MNELVPSPVQCRVIPSNTASHMTPLDIMMTSSNGDISALLVLCAGNLPAIGELPSQRPMTHREIDHSWVQWLLHYGNITLLSKFVDLLRGWPNKTHRGKQAYIFNTLRPRQNGHHCPDDISDAFSLMKMYKFRLRFHWSLFPRAQITVFQHWFR